METKSRRKMAAILRVLHDAGHPLGGERIAESLRQSGMDLGERTVRNYLAAADALGWTENLGRRGRRLTDVGRRELDGAFAVDKVGYVAARVDELSYKSSFDPVTRTGTVILNVSTMALRDVRPAFAEIKKVFDANLGMGRLITVAMPGDKLGGFVVPSELLAIGTVCSVSINSILLRANIATTSRFGGLLEIEHRVPKRFTQIIHYDGTSLDPLEIFIRGHMTSVARAAATGSGVVGASFREVPAAAFAEAQRLVQLAEKIGIGGAFVTGRPNQPLLDIPVPMGRTGLVVCGGLNPMAAVVEHGIGTTSSAMHTLCDFEHLFEYTEAHKHLPRRML